MTVATAPARRLYRAPGGGPALGVAAAIAEHVGVDPKIVRWIFVGLAAAGGLGAVLYGVFYVVLPITPVVDGARGRSRRETVIAVALAIAGVVIVGRTLPQSGLLLPVMLAGLGGALIWRQASDSDRSRLLALSRTSLSADTGGRTGQLRLLAGAALVVAGALLVLARADVTAVRDGLLAVVVTLVGVALVTGPWWMRLVNQVSAEREERIRTQERADLAAHLHDSVLQTLALIQRNAGSPREVVRLARGQERDLRGLLYASRVPSGRFGEQMRTAAAEVEDAYAISVELVAVGDVDDVLTDDGLAAVVAAAREALVNAAKHADVELVSLFVEVEPDEVGVFVKDRGTGFELDAVAADRQGVRGSIIGRVERHGGTVRITSTPGAGTEVEIRMPVTRPTGGAE